MRLVKMYQIGNSGVPSSSSSDFYLGEVLVWLTPQELGQSYQSHL
jgi:hypothetical protein